MEHKEHEHKEIGHKTHPPHHTRSSHKKELPKNTKFVVMAVLLGLLIVVAGVQAIELVGLKDKLGSEMTTLLASSGKVVAATGGGGSASPSLKKNLQNLPTMVGGC